MKKRRNKRVVVWCKAVFEIALRERTIRPASLEDVAGTHHQRQLVQHPNTGQWFVRVM